MRKEGLIEFQFAGWVVATGSKPLHWFSAVFFISDALFRLMSLLIQMQMHTYLQILLQKVICLLNTLPSQNGLS